MKYFKTSNEYSNETSNLIITDWESFQSWMQDHPSQKYSTTTGFAAPSERDIPLWHVPHVIESIRTAINPPVSEYMQFYNAHHGIEPETVEVSLDCPELSVFISETHSILEFGTDMGWSDYTIRSLEESDPDTHDRAALIFNSITTPGSSEHKEIPMVFNENYEPIHEDTKMMFAVYNELSKHYPEFGRRTLSILKRLTEAEVDEIVANNAKFK